MCDKYKSESCSTQINGFLLFQNANNNLATIVLNTNFRHLEKKIEPQGRSVEIALLNL